MRSRSLPMAMSMPIRTSSASASASASPHTTTMTTMSIAPTTATARTSSSMTTTNMNQNQNQNQNQTPFPSEPLGETSASLVTHTQTNGGNGMKQQSCIMRQKCSSMTLDISATNANRMLEASRALNASLKSQQDQQQQSSSSSTMFDTDQLIPAAKATTNRLLLSFVKSMQEEVDKCLLTQEEMILSLLLFLDMDKSSKLLTAFEVLGNDHDNHDEKMMSLDPDPLLENHDMKVEENELSQDVIKKSTTTTSDEKNMTLPSLKRTQIRKLFQSFLVSISMCIHYKEDSNMNINNENDNDVLSHRRRQQPQQHVDSHKSIKMEEHDSPQSHQQKNMDDNDSSSSSSSSSSNNININLISNDTRREIEDIANYATDRVVEDIQKRRRDHSDSHNNNNTNTTPLEENGNNTTTTTTISIGFHEIGEWYNSGGFSLVPWLELLDLAKWDYAGRSAASAAAAASAKEKHHQSRSSSSSASASSATSLSLALSSSNNTPTSSSNKNNSHNRHHGRDRNQRIQHPHPHPHEQQQQQQQQHIHNNIHTSKLNMDTIMENSVSDSMMPDSMESGLSPTIPDLFLRSPTLAAASPMPHPSSSSSLPSTNSSSSISLSRVLISFDFAGSSERQIQITKENLLQLQHLVTVTDLSRRSPGQVANVLLRQSKRRRVKTSSSSSQSKQEEVMMVLSRQDFGHCIRDLIPSETLRHLSPSQMDSVMNRFTNFFLCFGMMNSKSSLSLGVDHVNAKELAVGLSFLCSGNKSSKLASTFELIGEPNFPYLSHRRLMKYLRSYLTMLIAISQLSSSESTTIKTLNSLLAIEKSGETNSISNHMARLCDTVEVGARWTLDHFIQKHDAKRANTHLGNSTHENKIFFEDFASWYTDGGYTIAPWLEFLDLKKFMSLLNESEHTKLTNSTTAPPLNPPNASGQIRTFDECFARSPTPKKNLKARQPTQEEILFTFPLANKHSLVVLREDAAYVRTVVDHLGLLYLSPEDVWDRLYSYVKKNPPSPLSLYVAKCHKSGTGKGSDVNQKMFVEAIEKMLPSKSKRKRSSTTLASTPQETLENFFQSFDLDQVDRVSANQLMGGLTLLCGGKKSTKLAFAFGLFDMHNTNDTKTKAKKAKKHQAQDTEKSLCGKELFYFLRSFLIVMFSCCKQSLDLSAEAVGRYISDTANMVTDDVMKYQDRVRRSDRVNFNDFGNWYNEGGFETAPWLELLDLNKWVLLDEAKAEKLIAEAKPMRLREAKPELKDKSNEPVVSLSTSPKKSTMPPEFSCPPPPPDDEIDPHGDSFFDDIEMDGIGGDIGDMGFLFPDAGGKENMDQLQQPGLEIRSAEPSPYRMTLKEKEPKPLKFQLFTNESNAYTVSISQKRVQLLKHLVIESNLCNITISSACNKILGDENGKQISRAKFDSAMHSIINDTIMNQESRTLLSDLLTAVFNAFDFNKLGKADATELACGLTVLCEGRKSDKLEFAFELLDKERKGLVSRFQMVRYLQSFLLVLLNISSCALGSEPADDILHNQEGEKAEGNIALQRVICGASSWATEEVFKATPIERKEIKEGAEHIDFNNFADWYTRGGYNRIAWLELLDLHKWVLADP